MPGLIEAVQGIAIAARNNPPMPPMAFATKAVATPKIKSLALTPSPVPTNSPSYGTIERVMQPQEGGPPALGMLIKWDNWPSHTGYQVEISRDMWGWKPLMISTNSGEAQGVHILDLAVGEQPAVYYRIIPLP